MANKIINVKPLRIVNTILLIVIVVIVVIGIFFAGQLHPAFNRFLTFFLAFILISSLVVELVIYRKRKKMKIILNQGNIFIKTLLYFMSFCFLFLFLYFMVRIAFSPYLELFKYLLFPGVILIIFISPEWSTMHNTPLLLFIFINCLLYYLCILLILFIKQKIKNRQAKNIKGDSIKE